MEAEMLSTEFIAAFKRAGLKGRFDSFDPYTMRTRSYGIQWIDPKGSDTFFMRTMSEIFPMVTEFNPWPFDQPIKHPTLLIYLKPARPISGKTVGPKPGEW